MRVYSSLTAVHDVQLGALIGAVTLACVAAGPALAQSAKRDAIADLITNTGSIDKSGAAEAEALAADPRDGDPAYEQAKRLMAAIDAVLRDAADNRSAMKDLPSRKDYVLPPLFTETKEDREAKVRALVDAALGIVTDVPVVDVQNKVEGLRRDIRDLEDQIVKLREKQISAPKDGMLPGVVTDTVASIEGDIKGLEAKIEGNRAAIAAAKSEIAAGLAKSGVELGSAEVDLLLDSVLSGDLVRLVAVFNAAKAIDGQLARMMAASGDNMNAARKYFAMHAALFAMLVQAQDTTIAKIDTHYVPKLDAIIADIQAAQKKTAELIKADNRPDQVRALQANRDSQKLAAEAAQGYRRYLQQQREQIAQARIRAAHDLRIADNTYETVEASFQLRNLMREGSSSFEAIRKLEAPSFDQIFRNEELRREFEALTRKLDAPSS